MIAQYGRIIVTLVISFQVSQSHIYDKYFLVSLHL